MADGTLHVSVSSNPEAVTMTLQGEVDPHTSPQWHAAIEEAIADAADGAELVIDVLGVTFMDSSGLRVLIDAAKAMTARGSRLVVDHPSETVRRLLDITLLSDEIEVRS